MTICALNKDSKDNTCFSADHVDILTKYTDANTLAQVKEKTQCVDDICVLEKVDMPIEIKGKIEREALKAPASSFDHNYWLNNTEIDTVMSQFRVQNPGFAHAFIHMIDIKDFKPQNLETFDYKVHPVDSPEVDLGKEIAVGLCRRGAITKEVQDYVCKLSTAKNAPLTSFGVICNTDSSKGSGQHWFAVYISTDRRDPENTSKPMVVIEVFNSAGGGSKDSEFQAFWEKKATEIARETGLKCIRETVTEIPHQSSKTGNCGSYSLFYIYARLNGVHPSEFNNPDAPVTDYSMRKFREVCFRLDPSSPF